LKTILLFAFVLTTSILQLSAQVTPCFTATERRGCAPFELELINCSSGNVALYIVTGKDGFEEQFFGLSVSTTLTIPGFYTVKQYAGAGSVVGVSPLERTDYIEVLSSPTPQYTLKLCEGRKIEVHTVAGPYEEYSITPGDGSPSATIPAGNVYTHTYTNTTDKTLIVKGNYNPGSCGASSSSAIKPFDALIKPLISGIQTEPGKVSISFATDSRFKYRLLESRQSGPYAIIDSIRYQSGNHTIELNRDTDTYFYTYMLETYDDCGNKSSSDPLNTLLVMIENLNKAVQVRIRRSNLSSFDRINTYKNNVLFNSAINPDLNNNLDINDDLIECGIQYCFRVEGIKGTAKSTVAEYCVIGKDIQTPDAITDLNSSFNQDAIVLTWTLPDVPFKKQNLYLNQNTVWDQIAQTTASRYTIENPGLEKDLCFRLDYVDQCDNNSSVSQSTCPVILSLKKDGNSYILNWNAYSGSQTISGYTLVKYDENMNVLAQYDVTHLSSYTDPVSDDGGVFYYRIILESPSGFISYSNTTEAREEMLLLIPTAFTPNGDGQNDVFRVKGKYVRSFSMTIYNNWGEAIFHSDALNKSWNGKKFTDDVPSGVYTYVIEATDFQGNTQKKSGAITLVR